VLDLRKLGDVLAGILERDELATAGKRDRVFELPFPAATSLRGRGQAVAAFRFLRQPTRPIAARALANSGRAAGSGVAATGVYV
jgi:hypothetical protein